MCFFLMSFSGARPKIKGDQGDLEQGLRECTCISPSEMVCVSVCECSCVCQVSVSVLLAAGSPAQTKLPVRGLTSPTPQSTIHRGQPGHAVRLLWYVTLASLSLFSLYLFHCSSFYASVPSYFVQLFYNGRQCRLWGQRCPMSPSGASYCCLLSVDTAYRIACSYPYKEG